MNFLKKSMKEVQKVIWPEQRDAFQTLLILIAIIVTIAVFIYVVDWGLSWLKTEGYNTVNTWLESLDFWFFSNSGSE